LLGTLLALLGGIVLAAPVSAESRITYTSSPDRMAIFMNDIAYARDAFVLPGGADVRVRLPDTVFVETVILREDGERVPMYRMGRRADGPSIDWQSSSDSDTREISLEYVLGGVGWSPKYDMWIGADTDKTVEFDFFAEIRNSNLELDEVEVQLVAGRVDTAGVVNAVAEMTANQRLAGYEAADVVTSASVGQASIQHVYDIGVVTAEPGDTVGVRMSESTLPARRLHIWNAAVDDSVTVIYKVKNESEMPFAEGIVRNYQDDLFIGADFIELTPVSGEGSVTVGQLKDVRVTRKESRTAIDEGRFDHFHEVELSVTNLGPVAVDVEVVDQWHPSAEQFHASLEPVRTPDNMLRWEITVEPGETEIVDYSFKVD
jgi:hypothetical protein